MSELYTQPLQFEPLLPRQGVGALIGKSRRVVEGALRLQGALHPVSLSVLRELVRSMNSYYSNLIEGQGTHPRNIERALRADFSAKPEVARRQRIAMAHMSAERELEQWMTEHGMAEGKALQSSFLRKAHRALYERLDEADRTTPDGRTIAPGQLRQADVDVGRHIAPSHAAVPVFLRRMDEVYRQAVGLDNLLITAAAAHHRAAWVHPFLDGNGRACRLQTHCALLPLSGGLWSVSRGFGRARDAYYASLADADMPRHGDLDGRGNLSERMLLKWCEFFIDTCLDQVEFMGQMLDLEKLRERVEALVLVRTAQPAQYPNYRKEAVLPLHHVLLAGSISRGEFTQMTGLGERTARPILSQLLKDGLLQSDSPKGRVYVGFPLDALNILFPNLYPEAGTTNAET